MTPFQSFNSLLVISSSGSSRESRFAMSKYSCEDSHRYSQVPKVLQVLQVIVIVHGVFSFNEQTRLISDLEYKILELSN